jgi:diguanylate cyclase (GGDEF)-like protein
LQEVSTRLEDLFRASDTVCRLGGDEFVVVLNEMADVTDAIRAAEKLLQTIRPDMAIDGQAMGISPSIGIAVYPHDGADLDGLLRNADIAMYEAKRAGGKGFRFFTETDQKSSDNPNT